MQDLGTFLLDPSFWINFLLILYAVTLHEIAHGYVAFWCGDTTAKKCGRLSLNPLRHMDLFGSVLLPLSLFLLHAPLLFGYAKPVPVQARQLRNPRYDMAKVAIAGPLMNFFLALLPWVLYALVGHHFTTMGPTLRDVLMTNTAINVVLGTINLVPILPLDGGRILNAFLPCSLQKYFQKTELVGLFILFGLIMTKSLDRGLQGILVIFFRGLKYGGLL